MGDASELAGIPLPPPWREEQAADGVSAYVNDVTGERRAEHPGEVFWRSRWSSVVGDVSAPPPEEEEDGDYAAGVPGRPYVDTVGGALTVTAAGGGHPPPSKKQRCWDFRCLWKELGLFGNVNSYGLTLRYFEDGSTVVRFDGLDGQWVFSQLEGTHGPIERYDLFVGAKIRVFGRHLTISSTSASTCQWIDEEGKRLQKRQDWLQSKIESVGAVPVVRRNEPIGVKCNFTKKANSGNADLRRLHGENAKLAAQLAELGMGSGAGAAFAHD